MSQPLTILLTTEGTYPYAEGGVSTWCDALIHQMGKINFKLMAFIPMPGCVPFYKLPPNVTEFVTVPLWGTGGVNELSQKIGFREIFNLRHRITYKSLSNSFKEPFTTLIKALLEEDSSPQVLGKALLSLSRFFDTHDYDAVFRHQLTWEIFIEEVSKCTTLLQESFPEAASPNLEDLIEALRLLYRWLSPITLPTPQADVIHSSAAGISSLPGIISRLKYGTPFLLTEHGVYLRERYLAWAKTNLSPFMKFFFSRVTKKLIELTYATADLIAPVAAWNARWEERLGAKPEQIKPIPNGIDLNRFTPGPMPPDDSPTLIWVGRIDPLKDLLTMIKAMKLVHQSIPQARLLLFGKAPVGNEAYDAMCREAVQELGLEEVVRFMGFASSPREAYIQGHVVVLSSISEALPFSVIEAMFCGRTVVGTEVGGVPEVVGGIGRIVPPREPEAMAQACIELLNDPTLYKELGVKAREKAIAHYTLQSSIDQYLAAYESLRTRAVPFTVTLPADTAAIQERSGGKVYLPSR